MANHRRRFDSRDPRCWARAAAAGAIGTAASNEMSVAIRGEQWLPNGDPITAGDDWQRRPVYGGPSLEDADEPLTPLHKGFAFPDAPGLPVEVYGDLITVEDLPEETEPRLFQALPSILDERLDSGATGLSSRITDPLMAAGIETVEVLIGNSEDELLKVKGFGPHALTRVQQFLGEHDLKLKGDE